MFVKDMKLLIKYAIELDISGLECKVGYKGDAILRLSSSDPDTLQKIWLMRRMYIQMISPPPSGAGMDQAVATEAILQRMSRAKTNAAFLETLAQSM
jgi:transcription termination factor Rho